VLQRVFASTVTAHVRRIYATINASAKPTTKPNKIPSGTELTLRAKTPAATPAMSPFIVEPTMIPAICGRVAGVNLVSGGAVLGGGDVGE
jgi:hypothetical protein